MKLGLAIGFVFLINHVTPAQHLAEHDAFRSELLKTYKKLKGSPEERTQLNELKSLPFFPFDSSLRVPAILDITGSSGFLEMKTSRGRVALYRRYGYLNFSLADREFRVPLYQAKSAADSNSDELFFPFTDSTNGETTYGGGRYIDLTIPKGKEIILDFNRAYNPYCAYSHVYSCEIPPKENHLPVRIEAGLKY